MGHPLGHTLLYAHCSTVMYANSGDAAHDHPNELEQAFGFRVHVAGRGREGLWIRCLSFNSESADCYN